MNKYISSISLRIDLSSVIASILLVILGIMVIYSAEYYPLTQFEAEKEGTLYIKQLIFLMPGLALMVFLYFYNYQNLNRYSIPIYIVTIVLLVAVLLFGREVSGAKSWFGVGSFGIQPSEFSKLFIIIVLAVYLDKIGNRIKELRYLLLSMIIIAIPAGLIFLQPDPGTIMIFGLIYLTMIYIAGCQLRHFISILCMGGLSLVIGILGKLTPDRINEMIIPIYSIVSDELLVVEIAGLALSFFLISYFITKKYKSKILFYISIVFFVISFGFLCSFAVKYSLKTHHVKRLTTFLMSDVNPLDEGYQVRQSRIAIGSGQIFGQGWTKGEHNHSNLLRKGKDTDYIFSVLAEEFGFMGVIFLFILYAVILYRGVTIIYNARDNFGSILSSGVVSMIAFHIFINIGMCTGVMPVIGIPLPFMSAGGSSLITFLGGIGVLLSIDARKYQH